MQPEAGSEMARPFLLDILISGDEGSKGIFLQFSVSLK